MPLSYHASVNIACDVMNRNSLSAFQTHNTLVPDQSSYAIQVCCVAATQGLHTPAHQKKEKRKNTLESFLIILNFSWVTNECQKSLLQYQVQNPFYSTRCSQCTRFRHRSLSVTFQNLFERLSHNPILSTMQYSGTLHRILLYFHKEYPT